MGILGVILGILAVLCAVVATAMFGSTGLIITVVLAVVAILLGILKRRKDKKGGIAAIVAAVLAILMAFGLTNLWSNVFKTAHDQAVEYKPDGLWAQASEDTSHGLMGIVSKLPQDEASLKALMDEMNELNKQAEAQK